MKCLLCNEQTFEHPELDAKGRPQVSRYCAGHLLDQRLARVVPVAPVLALAKKEKRR